jgi:hypothetical protein
MSDGCAHSAHPGGGSNTFYSTALGGQNERRLRTFSTPRRDQTPSAAPLWEARMSDGCAHSAHPGGGSNTFYSTALGGQNERRLRTFSTPRRGQTPSTAPIWETRMSDSCAHPQHTQEGSNTFYSTALGGQNERRLRTFSTPRRDQTPSTAPLWEARMSDGCAHSAHPGGIKHLLQHRSGRPE